MDWWSFSKGFEHSDHEVFSTILVELEIFSILEENKKFIYSIDTQYSEKEA